MSTIRIEKPGRQHSVDDFDRGHEALNRYLIRFAWQNQQGNAAITYVGVVDDAVVGFYTLTVGGIAYAEASERLVKGLARYPGPVLILARLAVRLKWQGHGVGAGLLKDAMSRTVNASAIAGIRALVVHAKDDTAKAFYQRFNFVQVNSGPLDLSLLVRDIPR